jgi:type I restriction enzyme M protein
LERKPKTNTATIDAISPDTVADAPAAKPVRRPKAEATPVTTAQRLGSVIKSARDIMRKDKGLNGDLDRLPMLTWILFLKFLDDMEKLREDEASLESKKFVPAIDRPYRWRDWAAKADGITGDPLIKFIQIDEGTRPDGSTGPGLFAYLRGLRGEGGAATGRRGVIAKVFEGVNNRMLSGYLLRDVINLIDSIHFNSRDEIHTLGHLYESMLKEMRDAAGDSGEFYTPRAVVRFMVAAVNPQLGDIVLDPACGTGGSWSNPSTISPSNAKPSSSATPSKPAAFAAVKPNRCRCCSAK